MKKTMKFAMALLLAVLIGGSGMAGLFAGQTTAASSQSEAMKAAGAEPGPQTTQENQEKEKAFLAQVEQRKAIEAEMQKRAAEAELNAPVVKTYGLKFISTSEFMRSAKFYVYDFSGTETTLTVKIAKKNIPDFEALLKKLDVEKKNIRFQVYTIVASKEDIPESSASYLQSYVKSETKEITDKDLKAVLDELKGLWNFKHYWVETPSFLMAKDGSNSNHSKLVSRHNLDLTLRDVQLRGEESGKRIVSVGNIGLTQKYDNESAVLIDTSNMTFKEKGYLVVGVSGVQTGLSSTALILVISAEIK
jgi:hypothetical protein